jgi:hypothetical protein
VDVECDVVCTPEYFKHLPPSLTELKVPPVSWDTTTSKSASEEAAFLSSPEFIECFRHFPNTLTDLSFGFPLMNGGTGSYKPRKLIEDCFAHLPASLTRLNLENVSMCITDRFWDAIPPSIGYISINPETFDRSPSASERLDEYLSKFEIKNWR